MVHPIPPHSHSMVDLWAVVEVTEYEQVENDSENEDHKEPKAVEQENLSRFPCDSVVIEVMEYVQIKKNFSTDDHHI